MEGLSLSAPPALVPTVEDIYQAYPLKKERPQALKAIREATKRYGAAFLLERTLAYARARGGVMEFVPYPQKWFRREGFNDDPATWPPRPCVAPAGLPARKMSVFEIEKRTVAINDAINAIVRAAPKDRETGKRDYTAEQRAGLDQLKGEREKLKEALRSANG